MYDESKYMSCCYCDNVFLREEAIRTPELHGGFCQEECAFRCLRANNFLKLGDDAFFQMNAHEGGEQVPGIREESTRQINDLALRYRRGRQYE